MKRIAALIWIFSLSLVSLVPYASAAPIPPQITFTAVTGNGSFNNSVDLLKDGIIPGEQTSWTAASNVYWKGTSPNFIFDMNSTYLVQDIRASVDNNDTYEIDYSVDGTNWARLTEIRYNHGEIGWGMDTITSISGDPEYVSGVAFSPVSARYLKIYADSGDDMYSVGELQAFGSPVPLPSALLLFAPGLAGLAALRRRP